MLHCLKRVFSARCDFCKKNRLDAGQTQRAEMTMLVNVPALQLNIKAFDPIAENPKIIQ